MSGSVNNIPTGLLVPAQVPLDAKLYIADEASLINLGIASNLAYTYYEGMIVYCVAEKRRYEWREGAVGEVGLLPTGFTYPSPLVVNGVTYSNKTFNFFYVLQNMNMVNVGVGAPWYKGVDILTNAHQFRTFTSVGLIVSITTSLNELNIESKPGVNVGTGAGAYKGVNATSKLHEFRTFKSMNPAISIAQVGDEIQFNATFYNTLIQAGTGITVTGNGSAGNPYIISLASTTSPWLRGDIKEVFCTPTYMTTYFTQSGPNAGLGIGERTGWAICNGNNGTPNDNGRVAIAWGTSYPVLNATGGATSHTLLEAEMPIHNHDWLYGTEQDDDNSGGSNDEFTATAQGNWGPNNGVLTPPIANKGGGQPHNNMQPYVVRLKIMKL
jgi:hypothetical protein